MSNLENGYGPILEILKPEISGEVVSRNGEPIVSILAKPEVGRVTDRVGWMSVHAYFDRDEYKVPDLLRNEVRSKWKSVKERNPNTFNGINLGISHVFRESNGLYLHTRPVDYRSYVGTRNPDQMRGLNLDKSDAANPVAVCGVLVTSDKKALYTMRGKQQENYQANHHAVGGFVRSVHEEKVDLQKALMLEMFEEVAVSPKDVFSIDCLGLLYDEKSWHYELPYVVFTRETSGQIMEKEGDFTENQSVDWVDLNPDSLGALVVDKNRKWVPTGFANYLLLGRHTFKRGNEWFKEVMSQIG